MDETIIKLENGLRLMCPAAPALCTYVRVVDTNNQELGYWCDDEWSDAPAEVMGAIIGLLRKGPV